MEKSNLVDELLKKYGNEDMAVKKNTVSNKPCRFDYFVDAFENSTNDNGYYEDGYKTALNRYMDKARVNRNNLQIVEKTLKQELSQYNITSNASMYSQGYLDGLHMLEKALKKSKKEMMDIINNTIMNA